MEEDSKPIRRVPLWFTILIILAAIPGLILPLYAFTTGELQNESKRIFVWLFPFYVIVGAFLAWQCYGRRTLIAWILTIMMFLTDYAMIMLMRME